MLRRYWHSNWGSPGLELREGRGLSQSSFFQKRCHLTGLRYGEPITPWLFFPKLSIVSEDHYDDELLGEVDEELVCPLTLCLFRDPVIDPEGNTYEREAIMEALKEARVSPITRNPLHESQLRPNKVVKDLVKNMLRRAKQQQEWWDAPSFQESYLFPIKVRLLNGNKWVDVTMKSTDTILDVMYKIGPPLGIDIGEQNLYYEGALLSEYTKTFEESGIRPNGRVDVLLSEEEEDDESDAPLKCCITQRRMVDPVKDQQGYTYERQAILRQIEQNGVSPITGAPLRETDLVPDVGVRRALQRFREKRGSPGLLEVVIRQLTGKREYIWVGSHESVHALKKRIERCLCVDPDSQRLIFQGKTLYDGSKSVSECGIAHKSVIDLTLRYVGGSRQTT